jgi:hypothetical protein
MSSIKLVHGHQNNSWTEGRSAVNIRNDDGSFLIFTTNIAQKRIGHLLRTLTLTIPTLKKMICLMIRKTLLVKKKWIN